MASLLAGQPTPDDETSDDGKVVTAYCEPWSVRVGEVVTLRASSHRPCDATLSLVRISCGDPTSGRRDC